ncbi:hypothetical protein ACJJTC_009873 [Scirpophaga incertulas]
MVTSRACCRCWRRGRCSTCCRRRAARVRRVPRRSPTGPPRRSAGSSNRRRLLAGELPPPPTSNGHIARVLPLLETRPLLDLLQAARRSRTPRAKTLANWATKEIRRLKQPTPLTSW